MALEAKYLLDFEKPIADLYKKIEDLRKLAKSGDMGMEDETKAMEERIEFLRREIFSNLKPNQIVSLSRHIMRPTTLDYLDIMFEDFVELKGDRNFADDSAIVGGFARLPKPERLSDGGQAKFGGDHVMVIGHQKGKTTKENIARNFGMAHPEGYRKALRLMKLADKFNRPIITFVDTPGAYPGIDAEERGQAEAIAVNLREMMQLKVPIIVVITGEGGSGGALGIAVGNRVLMLEYSIYSVISPEGCASILFRDAKRSPEAAINMKITAPDLLELNVIDEIINEPLGGAHNDYSLTALNIKSVLRKHLDELSKMSTSELLKKRYEKFRNMGVFTDNS